jgi:hypothetical protein
MKFDYTKNYKKNTIKIHRNLSQSIVKAEGISPSSKPIALGVLQSQIVIFTPVTVAKACVDSRSGASLLSNLRHFYLLITIYFWGFNFSPKLYLCCTTFCFGATRALDFVTLPGASALVA